MNVSELYRLTLWIEDEIVNVEIPQKYQALQQLLQQNAQPNQQQKPFRSQKNELIKAIEKVPLNQLTREQLKFLECLGIEKAVGIDGINIVTGILYENSLDIATAAREIQNILNKLTQGIEKSKQIQDGLSECVNIEEYREIEEVMIRVTFAEQASMSNVADFKTWGNIWYDIARGITLAHNLSPEDVKIVGATNGSIVIELAVIAGVATTTSSIILSGLKVAEKVLDIQKKAAEIRGMNLKNKKLANDIEKEAKNEKKAGIKAISEKMIKELKIKKNEEGDKVIALEKAVNNLVNFLESGGELDFILPEEDEGDENDDEMLKYKELRATFQEIRQLENKIKLLESRDI